MPCTCGMKNVKIDKRYKYSYWDLLMLKRPNKLDEFISTVKKPKDADTLLQNGLPRWKIISLDSKIPLIDAPKGSVYYSCNKVGKKLWRTTDKPDFNLYDLAGNDINFKYNPLHDEHLRPFFSRKINRKYLIEKGYINKKGEVICSLKELNDYRRYLKKVYNDEINRNRQIADEVERDKQLLAMAHKYALQFQDHELRRTHIMELSKPSREKQAKEQEIKDQKNAMRNKRREQYAKLFKKWKEEELRRRILQSHLRNERIRNRLANAHEIEVQRKSFIIRRWNKLEIQRQERLRQERINKIKDREAKIDNNWRNKTKFQIKKIKTNEQIISDYKCNMDVNISLRNRLVQEEKLRLEELFYSIKSKGKTTGVNKNKRKAIKDAVLELLASRKTSIISSKLVDEAVAEALKAGVEDVYLIVKGAQMKLEQAAAAPDAVNYVIDCILENSIEQYVRKNVREVLENVYLKAREHTLKAVSTKSITSDTKKFSADIGSRMQSKLVLNSDVKSLTRGVSFGAVHTIDEFPTNPELRSIKDRPPTPVPSFTELVSIAFSDPVTAPQYEKYEADIGRSTLRKMLHELSKQALKLTLKRITKSADLKKRITMNPVSAINFGEVVPKLTKALLTSNITNFSECEEVQQAVDAMFESFSRTSHTCSHMSFSKYLQ